MCIHGFFFCVYIKRNFKILLYNMKLLLEASFVGASLAIALVLVHMFVKPTRAIHIISLGFVVGFVMHLAFEWLGLNLYYCKHGVACST